MGLMLLSTWVRHNGVDKKSIMYVGRMRAEPCGGPNVGRYRNISKTRFRRRR